MSVFDVSEVDAGARPGRMPKEPAYLPGVEGITKVMSVREAKHERMEVRDWMGNSRQDTPTVSALLAAATHLSALLVDASAGHLRLLVEDDEGETSSVGVALSMLISQDQASR